LRISFANGLESKGRGQTLKEDLRVGGQAAGEDGFK